MSLDFTLDKYRELCQAVVNSRYTVFTVGDYLTMQSPPAKFIISRHDIDIWPREAMRMAELEKEFSIKSTYYFKYNNKVFQPQLIREIASMGHEIGYHYEVVDKAKGNYEQAVQIFEAELSEFRKICDVKTICSHGNSLTKWDNRHLWITHDYRKFDIVGEAYLSLSDVAYLSDTGRTWNNRYKIKDKMLRGGEPGSGVGYDTVNNNVRINTTTDLIRLVKAETYPRLCIQSHPASWSVGSCQWLKLLVMSISINLGKILILKLRHSVPE